MTGKRMGRPFKSKDGKPLAKIAVLVEQDDIDWLDAVVKRLKERRSGISRGELIRFTIKRLRNEKWDDRDMLVAMSVLL